MISKANYENICHWNWRVSSSSINSWQDTPDVPKVFHVNMVEKAVESPKSHEECCCMAISRRGQGFPGKEEVGPSLLPTFPFVYWSWHWAWGLTGQSFGWGWLFPMWVLWRGVRKNNTPFFFYAQLLTWEYNRLHFLQSSSPTYRVTRCTICLG